MSKKVSKGIPLKRKVRMVEEITYLCPKCGEEMFEDGRHMELIFVCSDEKCHFMIHSEVFDKTGEGDDGKTYTFR